MIKTGNYEEFKIKMAESLRNKEGGSKKLREFSEQLINKETQ